MNFLKGLFQHNENEQRALMEFAITAALVFVIAMALIGLLIWL